MDHNLFTGHLMITQIFQDIVIPIVRLRDEDEELFKVKYIEFIKRDMEGDIHIRMRIASEFLLGFQCRITFPLSRLPRHPLLKTGALPPGRGFTFRGLSKPNYTIALFCKNYIPSVSTYSTLSLKNLSLAVRPRLHSSTPLNTPSTPSPSSTLVYSRVSMSVSSRVPISVSFKVPMVVFSKGSNNPSIEWNVEELHSLCLNFLDTLS
ncbi:hypothetical protein ACE6H2_008030 [Prunus campanulata]